MTPFCAVVDWGTSSFRLWILSEGGTVLGGRHSEEGMAAAAETGFDAVLEHHLDGLGADANLPVAICGMAGARQGWREAGYIDTPARIDDVPAHALRIDGHARDVRILPGIAQREAGAPDVMRGEETQLLGLVAKSTTSGLVCIPGTHSKWISLEDATVNGFSTYMTGELYAVISDHSILRLAIEDTLPTLSDDPVFLQAAQVSFAKPERLSNALFTIRSGQLLGYRKSWDNAAYLSGLLIGFELAGVVSRHGSPKEVVLIGAGALGMLYRSVLEAQNIAVHSVDAEEASRLGLWQAAKAFWQER